MVKKVAIITGGSKGLGAAIAKKLSKESISVAIFYKSSTISAREVVKQCHENNVDAIAIKTDVTKKKQCEISVREVVKKLGNINILINNAGTTKHVQFNDFDGLSEEDFIHIYKTNAISAYMMSRAVLNSMKKNKKGSIVNISSIAALGLGSSIAYSMSKGAMNSLSKALSRTLAPNITVNTISPGYIKTGWWGDQKQINKLAKKYANTAPLKKVASPEEVAEIVYWFVNSPHLITGENIYVDGGNHLKV